MNQLLLDFPAKLGMEIDILLSPKPFMFPNPSIDLAYIYITNLNLTLVKVEYMLEVRIYSILRINSEMWNQFKKVI